MDRKLLSPLRDTLRQGEGVPPESTLSMPVQDLRRRPATGAADPATPATRLARLAVFGGTIVLTWLGAEEMVKAVGVGGITSLEYVYVALFVITFGWIAFSAVAAVVGLLFAIWRGITTRRQAGAAAAEAEADGFVGLTALVMPVYNEDPVETMAALQAMAEALDEAGMARHYEIFVLSDSTNADAWIRESIAFRHLREALAGKMPVWYRRRWQNTARKAGNVADFIRRWGGRYEQFLVLDADSVLTAEAIIALTRGMAVDPRLGLLQSVPALVGGNTLFARLQQFAGAIYGPVLAEGLAVWAGNDGNYWGHNAIIRTRAFAETAGLPDLKGRKPFGGPIMSHDFVEAALMRRAGWRVRMDPNLAGSYEASPPSLIDVAVRDRRWAQGNLQHTVVLPTRGLRWPNRIHLATGIMSYLSASLWLTLIGTGIALAAQAQFIRPEYFSEDFQLFPNWPRFDSERMLMVFLATMAVLLLPKFLGYLRALFSARRRRAAGGVILLTMSVLVETVLSALYAPIMMLIQNHHLADILGGRDSGWSTQRRGSSGDAWREVTRLHRWHTTAGILLAVGLGLTNIDLLAWMSPVIAGLLLAIPLSWISGRPAIGKALRRLGLLLVEGETTRMPIIERRDDIAAEFGLLPEDALGYLAKHPEAAARHVAFNLARPQPVLGKPDADHLTAEAKLSDAATSDEALGWLTAAERVRIASDQRLLQRLAELGWWE